MTTRCWTAVVLYAVLDLTALHAELTWGSSRGLGNFFLLTIVVPVVALLWWVVGQIRPGTLY